jgi:hypothetical protein
MSPRRNMPSGSHRAVQNYINSRSEAEWADLVARTRARLHEDPDQRQALLEEMRRTPLPRWAGEASRYGAVLEALRARAASTMNLDTAELDTPEGTMLGVGSTTAMAALQPAITAGHVHVTPDTLLAVQENGYSREELWDWALDANLPLPWMYLDFSTTEQEGAAGADASGREHVVAGALCWQEDESLLVLPVGGPGTVVDARRSQLRSLLSPVRVVFGPKDSFNAVKLAGDIGIGPDEWVWSECAGQTGHPIWEAQQAALALARLPLARLLAYAEGELQLTCPLPSAEREAAAARGERIGLELRLDGDEFDSAEYVRLATTAMRTWKDSLPATDVVPDAPPPLRPTSLTPGAACLGTVLAGLVESVGDAAALFVRRGIEEGAYYATGVGRAWVGGEDPGAFSGLDAVLADFEYQDVTDASDLDRVIANADSGRADAVALFGGFVKDTAQRLSAQDVVLVMRAPAEERCDVFRWRHGRVRAYAEDTHTFDDLLQMAQEVAEIPVAAPEELPAKTRSGASKVGRNDPCPCGSGKKYKRCHGGR